MSEPIYHKQSCDTAKSWKAFQDFKSLPAHNRSVPILLSLYQNRVRVDSGLRKVNLPPSLSLGTLTRWCAECQWIERAKAWDADHEILLTAKRVEAQKTRIDKQVQTEQAQIEEFRTTALNIGKKMVQFATTTLYLIETVTEGLNGKDTLTDADLDHLLKTTRIFKAIAPSIPIGQESWAQALGVNEAIAVLAHSKAQ
jgi:hypothetical protein